jgi:hypothetical protein
MQSDPSLKLLVNLLNICEEMLFSITMKPEIVLKYQNMRQAVFDKLGVFNDFSKFLKCQEKAIEQSKQKKNFSEMEKNIMRNTIEGQNASLTKTLIIYSNFISNFKSTLSEAGTSDTEELSRFCISADISNYSSELQKFDGFLQYLLSRQGLLQKQCKFQQDSLNSLSCENLKLKTASEHLQKTYEESIQVLEKTYQNKISLISKNNLTDVKKFNELEMSFHEKESILIDQIDKITVEDASVLKDLREKLDKSHFKNQELRNVLKVLVERVSTIFEEFIDKEEINEHYVRRKNEIFEARCGKTWGNFADLFVEIDFIGYALHKLKGDNDWLVEQLDVFCKENEDLKEFIVEGQKNKKIEKVFKSISSNELAVKDFNEARNKLVMQFKDSNKEV